MHLRNLISLLLLHSFIPSIALNQEGKVLLSLKTSLSHPGGCFSSWSDVDDGPCNWAGVTCDRRGSVVSVVLTNASLSGLFPVVLCGLPSLHELILSDNYIGGSLPPLISSCRNLTYLDISLNELVGPLPQSLSELPSLRYLNLEGNNFSGEIPPSLGHFRQLEELLLANNLLTGSIPPALGNITTLKRLELTLNPFSKAKLPEELGNLTNLEVIWVADCNLIGTIPTSFRKLTRLQNLDVSNNGLTGVIPRLIFELKSIVQLELYRNSFTGELPPSGWLNLTSLRRFDASENRLMGRIPDELCQLPLESLNLETNHLEGSIPEAIANSQNLYELKLFGNQLTGSLPNELGKNSPLQTLDVSNCNLSGELPKFLCQSRALQELMIIDNSFSGTIPPNLAECKSLQRIRMRGNKLSGEVPPEFWSLPHVYLLELHGNAFSGSIPHSISEAKNLSTLRISENRFTGSIPSEIGSVSTLIEFSAHDNELTGEIPRTIVNIHQLEILDLSDNNLSGGLPKRIESLKCLNELRLSSNRLSGHIPDEIGNMEVLNYLDLSQNDFSGSIPQSLQNLKLNILNLSYNNLSGHIPEFFAEEIYKCSFMGNPYLCTNDSESCSSKAYQGNQLFYWSLMCFFVTFTLTLLIGLAWFLFKYKKLKEEEKGFNKIKWTLFHKLAFNELEILDSLKETNVIGTGASGKVYKVILSNGASVAVKKLHYISHKSNTRDSNIKDEYDTEVETLGNIRHKNIVRLWCCCNTESYKLLVYEYMTNGSLGDFLHRQKSKLLNWPVRFKIVLDTAEALCYLHHNCVPPILHRDVKSNNILLDHDFGAKISDFGVAKVFTSSKSSLEPMSAIAGSYGYIAPGKVFPVNMNIIFYTKLTEGRYPITEYAYTLRVNEKSDIYSFGIVILELITGKPAVDPELQEKDLAIWVRTALHGEETLSQVIDKDLDSRFKDHICNVLKIGMLCTSKHPNNRPPMKRVVNMLQELSVVISVSRRQYDKRRS